MRVVAPAATMTGEVKMVGVIDDHRQRGGDECSSIADCVAGVDTVLTLPSRAE
jgi:hypothetical protein